MEGQARRSEPLKQQPFTTPITIPSGLMETPWPQNAGRAAHRVLVKGNGVEAFSRLAAHAPITPTVLEKEIGGRDDQRVWFTFPRASYSVRWAGRSSAFYRPGENAPWEEDHFRGPIRCGECLAKNPERHPDPRLSLDVEVQRLGCSGADPRLSQYRSGRGDAVSDLSAVPRQPSRTSSGPRTVFDLPRTNH
jgi:hypothetical protein